ncbi:hypothetical protein SAMN05216559_2187 [Halomicrobium zhouii]|uniref:DUF7965 domain-containing protein n=1 Tax=Halomicrobium zhouii TaxID=767519 RepID=A0A1I6L732_9EURY|nr:hypothetical protein [Halomicrobium zhouii]SFR99311.1 hypothetical protein SAMN05216559_2187 [Halomicrobium zhouii]
MAEVDRRLLVWTLASFHVAGLTIGFVIPAYASGGLSDVLPEFGTIPGVLGYAYLWVLSWLATRWVLTDEVFEATLAGAVRPVILRGSAGGGLVGLGTLVGPLLLLSLPDLVTGSADLTSVVLIFAIGAGIATAVGVAFGLVFTLLDLAAVRVAAVAVPDGSGSDPIAADATPESDRVGERS